MTAFLPREFMAPCAPVGRHLPCTWNISVRNHDFNTTILDQLNHRPWPMPSRPWAMTQTWHDLLFAHWPVDVATLRSRVPADLDLDLFDGVAWLGVVAFHMTNVAPRAIPSLPWLSAFPELNVRTYVRVDNRAGIYFFSLDAASALAVRGARVMFNLPYYVASMRVVSEAAQVEYHSVRQAEPAAAFSATYRGSGPVFHANPGSLEHFLTERYCLYHHDHRRRPYRLEIHHPPWPLQAARGEVHRNSMTDNLGLHLSAGPPTLHFAKRQDVVAWLPSRLSLR